MPHGRDSGRLSLRAIPGTTSTKTHSVIGVSADPHAGTEDWTDGFSLTDQFPLSNTVQYPTPNSPASHRAAALLRIAKEENAPHRQRGSSSTTGSRITQASVFPPSAKPAERLKPREEWESGPSGRGGKTGGVSATAATAASGIGEGGASSSIKSSSGRLSKNTRSANPSSSSRQHRKEPPEGVILDLSSRPIRRERDHGKSSSSSRRVESGRSRRSSRPSESTASVEGSKRRTYSSSSRRPETEGSRSKGDNEANLKQRRSRENRNASRNASASEATGSDDEESAARPWEDILDAMNDNPTDSELTTAASSTARGTGERNVSPKWSSTQCSYVGAVFQE